MQVSGSWVAKWREQGRQRKKTIGRVAAMTKSDARRELDRLVGGSGGPAQLNLNAFAEETYFPFYSEKWKGSTLTTNRCRVRVHIQDAFGHRPIDGFSRGELQRFLTEKAKTLSFAVVDHLRWDLRQIFAMALAEGLIGNNPAAMLFTPGLLGAPGDGC